MRPHPHIGLATVTYLFEGEILHRDSLGVCQAIRPGAVNWMVAGRGIVHSERSREELRKIGARLHGVQVWIALPGEHEETEPAFWHHPEESLPSFDLGGVALRLLVGSAYGQRSPVETHSPMFYIDAKLPAGAVLALPEEHHERAVYVIDGEVECGLERAEHGRMLVFTPGARCSLRALKESRVMLFGGAPIDGERFIFWNFVSSSKARIETAKRDWREGRFEKVPGDETEFIPLPE